MAWVGAARTGRAWRPGAPGRDDRADADSRRRPGEPGGWRAGLRHCWRRAIRGSEAVAVTMPVMAILRGLASAVSTATSQALDLALPATCSGCRREGEALCVSCGRA